jgi:hypothetical protein
LREHQQCEVTTLREDKNNNGNRILETVRGTQIIGKKPSKLNKRKSNLENLQEAIENRWKTSQKAGLQDLNLVRIAEPCRMGLRLGKSI